MRVVARAAATGVLAVAIGLGGCNAQNSREAGGAIGGLLGAVLGAAVGSNNDMGAAGAALIGGVAGFMVGSLIGQILDDVDQERQSTATRRALDGDGGRVEWVGHEDPESIRGHTDIVSTRVVSPPDEGGEGGRTVTEVRHDARASKAAPVTKPPAVAASSNQSICRTAKEVVWVEGRERVEMNEYCRAAGTSAWVKKAA